MAYLEAGRYPKRSDRTRPRYCILYIVLDDSSRTATISNLRLRDIGRAVPVLEVRIWVVAAGHGVC